MVDTTTIFNDFSYYEHDGLPSSSSSSQASDIGVVHTAHLSSSLSWKIGTFNVKGLGNDEKRAYIFKHIRSYDIVVLCETHCGSVKTARFWTKQWSVSGRALWTTCSSTSVGVAVFINASVLDQGFSLSDDDVDVDGRSVRFSLVGPAGLSFRISAVYAPNDISGRSAFFDRMTADSDIWRAGHSADYSLILGDFNTIDNALCDKVGGNAAAGAETALELQSFVHSERCVDVWRQLNPAVVATTFRQNGVGTRIDRIFASSSLLPFCAAHHVNGFADHDGVVCVVKLNPVKRGRGYWKLNCSHLSLSPFSDTIVPILRAWSVLPGDNIAHLYDKFKAAIKVAAISFAKKRKVELLIDQVMLERDHSDALAAWTAAPSPTNFAALSAARLALDDFRAVSFQGAAVRSRARWLQDGERPTKLFCSLERQRQRANMISSLRHPDDQRLCTNSRDLCDAAAAFYERLYSPAHASDPLATALLLQHMPKLPADAAAKLDAPITLAELDAALGHTPRNRTPGIDGLPAEFLSTYRTSLLPLLLLVFNDAIAHGALPSSSRTAVIQLVPKTGDLTQLSNYRPLSMLCTDYKLLAKVVARRLASIIDLLIAPDQTGFIRGRIIQENIQLLQGIIRRHKLHNMPGAALLLDQHKAFDTLLWDYRDAVLHHIGFGAYFCQLVTTLHADKSAVVSINGHHSRKIKILCGSPQGCPLSPLMYALMDEPLACLVRATTQLLGIELPDAGYERIVKLQQYADDKAVFLRQPSEIIEVKAILRLYEEAAGGRVNVTKSRLLLLGNETADNWRDSGFPIVSDNDTTTYLGIPFGPNVTDRDIWLACLAKFEAILALWARRDLTSTGRLAVLRSLACSKLWYCAAVLPLPADIEKQLNKAIWHFFWKGAPHGPVSREVCRSPKRLGGLGMFDAASMAHALQLTSLRRLLDTTDGKWKDLVIDELRSSDVVTKWGLGIRIVIAGFNQGTRASFASPFWQQVLHTAQRLNLRELQPTTAEGVLRQHLFYNKMIQLDGAPLGDAKLLKHFAKGGLHTVRNIVDPPTLALASAEQLGVPKTTLDRVISAIPRPWLRLLEAGRAPLRHGEWVLDTNGVLPVPYVLQTAQVEDGNVRCTRHPASRDGVFAAGNIDGIDGVVSRPPDILLRAHVVQHPTGLLCEGFADDMELDQGKLVIDQLVNGKVVTVPFAKSSVRGSSALLTKQIASAPSLSARWKPLMPLAIRWVAVWLWVWAAYRDLKVADFLWRLFHQALPLGYNRRGFARKQTDPAKSNTNCCVCPEMETYAHFLRDCPSSSAVWAWFRRVWSSAFPADPLHRDLLRALFLAPRKIRKRARSRLLVRSIVMGELLYTVWIQRCRALFDKQPNEFSPLVIIAVARFRIRRALTTVSHPSSKFSSDRLVAAVERLVSALDID